MRKNVSTGTPSEKRVGYSRMVIVNKKAYVTGTTAVNPQGETVGKTLYDQAKYIIRKIQNVLAKEKFSLKDVVSVTAYITKMRHIDEFDRTFREFFYDIKPTCTLVGIKELVKKDLLIEIECIAEKE